MAAVRDPIVHAEFNTFSTNSKLNWLRAAVLGANDGIVSISSVIVGVAAASSSRTFILTAGVAAMVAGALSMAVGEYVSVSSQRDTEKALLIKEQMELDTVPDEELEELIQIYEKKGLSRATAEIVGKELTARDAFAAHVDAELNINPDDLANPFHAAYASGIAFCCGAIIPVVAVIFASASLRLTITFISVIIALIITGMLSAYVGGAKKTRATLRVVIGGIMAMIITFGIGKLFGIAGI
ncbi:MAG: VIT family protein [Patescibacteria group bacterium]|nr:VIT family protein [Patescibacteria group bacterium]